MELRETVSDELGVWLVSVAIPAEEKVRARIAFLESVRDNYRGYLQVRIADDDWHGAWDASVNIAETNAQIEGLEYALRAFASEASAGVA